VTNQVDDNRKQTRQNAQAHILRAAKFSTADGKKARNWSLFFFFRILSQAEFDATLVRMKRTGDTTLDSAAAKRDLWLDFAEPGLLNAGLVDQCLADSQALKAGAPPSSPGTPPLSPDAPPLSPDALPSLADAPQSGRRPDDPAQAFLNWLRAIVSADKSGIQNTADQIQDPSKSTKASIAEGAKDIQPVAPTNADWADPVTWMQSQFAMKSMDASFLQSLVGIYTRPDEFAAHLQALADKVKITIPADGLGPLPIVALYEILRQCAPAMLNPSDSGEPAPGIIRGEEVDDPKSTTPIKDNTPINITFTYSGLAALKMNPATLASFPDVFKRGMAARAERLHDIGPSAPDFWEGELGLPSVHGYFTGGFALGAEHSEKESFWKAMRRDVEAFNDPVTDHGRMLRFGFRILFRLFGIEILHIELGQYPYEVDEDGAVKELEHRVEHFGFRDGLSQPFVDMGLGDTLPGGGTPSRDRTWSPVAPGEIFLDQPDENDEVQLLPISKDLTLGSTFLVFRKLEQDVAAFRGFLNRMRPKDKEAQTALSAQFVGRWPNGVPLVLSPDQQRDVNREMEDTLNDFRYAADDPLGVKCPLGAHIRRANPRDVGGRGEARRHRILRRGISYGGPLLKDGVLDDGESRGLLFIAANSRIDLQFEVIQSSWINGGEFLGQAGLGRCPLTGDHAGAVSDRFFETGAIAPMTGLPRFVTTRGGDYFFAPGIKALRMMAEGNPFSPDKIPFAGFSMGDATTPGLLDPERLQRYGRTILAPVGETAIHVKLPASSGDSSDKLCFIGRYDDVKAVLKNVTSSGQLAFSVRQYTANGQNITRGEDIIIGTEDVGPTQSTRERLRAVLYWAWETLGRAHDAARAPDIVLPEMVRAIARSASDEALRRTAYERRIDLVNDLAVQATYALIAKLYGVPAPDWLTELAASLRFAHQHVGEVPPEWIATLIDKRPDKPGLATLQIWSAIILADLIGNVQSIGALHALGRQAGTEMLNYIDSVLSAARISPPNSPIRSPKTLLGAFIRNESSRSLDIQRLYPSAGSNWPSLYYRDVGTVLLEIVGTSMATIPLTFASVMGAVLKFGLDLPTLVQMPDPNVLSHVIYEAERLNPNLAIRVRHCETQTTLPSGAPIDQGEWVVSLIAAANLDPRVFPEPFRFKLDRDIGTYLLFNEATNKRACWGRDRVAMHVLEECLKAASRLQGLRKVAGKGGEPTKLIGVTVTLPARFTQVAERIDQDTDNGRRDSPPQATSRDMAQATTPD
jgi:Dyp-type peroxidase family